MCIPCPCPCHMSKRMQHAPVHAAWLCPCWMPMSVLFTHVHAACPHHCCISMSMLHGPEHGAWTWALGCSDFHIFSESYQFYPIPVFLRTLRFRKYQKKDCHFCHLGRIFFYFFKNPYFFLNFQNQFSKSVFNQSLQNLQGIIFDK